jgi:O2-independent ubiquinone biosynthesis accessory factor UbiT
MLLRRLARCVPLCLAARAASGWAAHVAGENPEVFARLGPAVGARICIAPTDAPLAFILTPRPDAMEVTAHREPPPACDARISGPLRALLALLDGRADADALTFRRELEVTGNVEIATCLHAALDALEPSPAQTIAALYGPPGRAALALARRACFT